MVLAGGTLEETLGAASESLEESVAALRSAAGAVVTDICVLRCVMCDKTSVCVYISCCDGPLCSNRDWDVVIAVTECESSNACVYAYTSNVHTRYQYMYDVAVSIMTLVDSPVCYYMALCSTTVCTLRMHKYTGTDSCMFGLLYLE